MFGVRVLCRSATVLALAVLVRAGEVACGDEDAGDPVLTQPARTVLEAHELWNPDDPAKRMSAAAALRAAQTYVRDYAKHHEGAHPEWAHPHYGAAWQLWGPAD